MSDWIDFLPACEEPVRLAAPTVLASLNARERGMFFGQDQIALDGVEIVESDVCSEGDWIALLEELKPDVILSCWATPRLPASIRETDRPLRYLCHLSGSVRKVVPRELIQDGLLVTNWGRAAAFEVAEHALLFILASLRSLPLWAAALRTPLERQQATVDRLATRSLRRQRIGLHGFGGVARELLGLLAPFGVRCRVFSAGVPASFIQEHGAEAVSSLEELFSTSDVLVECEALTPVTVGSVTGSLLDRLPQDAVFVNVGRGAVVEEAALAERAASGRLRVASDVFADEPLKNDSPFWRAPCGLYSPHIAGPTQDANRLLGQSALRNLERFFAGGQPENLVTLTEYDRST